MTHTLSPLVVGKADGMNMRRTLSDDKYRVHMPSLRVGLCGVDKMPADFSCRQEMNIPSTNLKFDEEGNAYRTYMPGVWTVIVKTNAEVSKPGKRNYAKHRVFVVCKCNKEIPAGRLAQHVPYCSYFQDSQS